VPVFGLPHAVPAELDGGGVLEARDPRHSRQHHRRRNDERTVTGSTSTDAHTMRVQNQALLSLAANVETLTAHVRTLEAQLRRSASATGEEASGDAGTR
jgi:hypothetical protein